ncbi:hypothetical protein XENOCAPTIV_010685 [Xenoophorus captivus]|uniref:Uncharacterized protein n=1 Tax=Xenoophorus captivus TaxID=1517983 RepID=A0ABV0R9L5_9TELE
MTHPDIAELSDCLKHEQVSLEGNFLIAVLSINPEYLALFRFDDFHNKLCFTGSFGHDVFIGEAVVAQFFSSDYWSLQQLITHLPVPFYTKNSNIKYLIGLNGNMVDAMISK